MSPPATKSPTPSQASPGHPQHAPRPGSRWWACAATGLLWITSMGPVHAETPAPTTPVVNPCDSAAPMSAGHLVGLWQLTLWPENTSTGEPISQGAVLFQPHPEYAGSVRGRLKRSTPGNDVLALLSGDVVNGEFNLDESDDGVRMSATWVGTPTECGTRLRGVREPAAAMGETGTALRFELRKSAE